MVRVTSPQLAASPVASLPVESVAAAPLSAAAAELLLGLPPQAARDSAMTVAIARLTCFFIAVFSFCVGCVVRLRNLVQLIAPLLYSNGAASVYIPNPQCFFRGIVQFAYISAFLRFWLRNIAQVSSRPRYNKKHPPGAGAHTVEKVKICRRRRAVCGPCAAGAALRPATWWNPEGSADTLPPGGCWSACGTGCPAASGRRPCPAVLRRTARRTPPASCL